MSFYGQVLYEFSRLFSKINIENNNSQSAAASNPAGQDSLAPTEEWDQLNLVGGKRWIQLNSNKNNKIITIAHTAPDATAEGSSVSIITPLDKANEPETGIIPLEQGQCLKVSNYVYDNAGHIANMNHEYFSLPRVQGYDDFVDLSDRLTTVEQTYVSNDNSDSFDNLISSYLSENQYVQQNDLENKIQTHLDDNDYVTTTLTGELNNMYSVVPEQTITKAIGNIDGESKSIRSELNRFLAIDDKDEPKVYTISEAIQQLIKSLEILQGDLSTVKAANRAYEADIKSLTARIEALEGKTPTE